MKNIMELLAQGATALDGAGLFKYADAVDDILRRLAAETPTDQPKARALLSQMNNLVNQLEPTETGSSISLKAVKDMLSEIEVTIAKAATEKMGGSAVRAAAKDVLKRFLAASNSDNEYANEMYSPIIKPMVDALQAMLRLPDNLIV